ncbi:hypothetical protein BGW80DRAFT_1534287 [Lactifluus volemus]|nr:hypothetical protein BGW80DRAFT_1534287 [Lactifluus volemus]
MTNIIVHAGTNAKFQKRDLEIVGLATLEPIEVFGSNQAIATQFPSPSNRPSIDDHHDPIHYAIPRPGTSDAHRYSHQKADLIITPGSCGNGSRCLLDERRQSRNEPEEGAADVLFVWTRGKKKRKTEKWLSTLSGHIISTASEFDGAAGRARGTTTVVMRAILKTRRLPGRVRPSYPDSAASAARPVQIAVVAVVAWKWRPPCGAIVGLLKVLFPLPDIVVDRLQVCRRVVNAQGIARPSCDLDAVEGLVLTAEEIKDVVSSTGLWLIVRECTGGGVYAHREP